MKIPRPSQFFDLRFLSKKSPASQGQPGSADVSVCCIAGFQTRGASAISTRSTLRRAADLEIGGTAGLEAGGTFRRHHRRTEGIALIITLIMLAITLVMALAFLALAKHERASVTTNTETLVAKQAADSALAAAEGQIVANMLSSFTNGINVPGFTSGYSSNAYNLHLIVSTNYINPNGFLSGVASPTNVNYTYANGAFLNSFDLVQNIANLWYLPRAPVFVQTNAQIPAFDFRFYLDLNENGQFDPNGLQPVVSDNPTAPYYDNRGNQSAYNPPNVLSNFMVGDPEWVGMLAHPDAPHGPDNQFISRYAFIAVPAGNALDINYIHNQANNATIATSANDYYRRNQGVGSWELNLAAFLADLNTNNYLLNAGGWGASVGSGLDAPTASGSFYQYNESGLGEARPLNNSGAAFADARALLAYRYNANPLFSEDSVLANAPYAIPISGIDTYASGPLQYTLDTNENFYTWRSPTISRTSWSGADNNNLNHYFTISDFFNEPGLAGFTNRLRTTGAYRVAASGLMPTYDRYTYYRMLDQLGSDSTPQDGRLNLNYSNAIVRYDSSVVPNASSGMATNISVVIGAETNLVRWRPIDFFTAAADQMLRTYTSNWLYYVDGYQAFTNAYAVTAPFSITNIPVWVSNRFVYTPAVNRLLQLAANLYDATTNGNNNLPHVFRPLFRRVSHGGGNYDIFIIGYTPVTYVTGIRDTQLSPPYDVTYLVGSASVPNMDVSGPAIAAGGVPINVYGVPWIIGAKKGLPNFNQLSLLNAASVSRKMELTRTSSNPSLAKYGTNQMYVIGISNSLGLTFWNSASSAYPRPVRIYAADSLNVALTNGVNNWFNYYNYTFNYLTNSWPGSQWSGPNSQPNQNSFINFPGWDIFQSPMTYNFATALFDPSGQWQATTPPLPNLPQFGLLITNYLQAYILDGNNVIDYVQLRSPITVGGLNQALADPDYNGNYGTRPQWSTNSPSAPTPWGVLNQLVVSGNPSLAPAIGGGWEGRPPGFPALAQPTYANEAAFFRGFFTPTYNVSGIATPQVNRELVIQVPYTPSRTVYSSYLLQANDPLVHYTADDLNAQVGATAVWANQIYHNGVWAHSDDPLAQPLPIPPLSPIGGRYQPWGQKGQLAAMTGVDGNPYNLAYKDPLVWDSDNWDFPTNLYPTVGWIGRVHRGTPWQTVYLKSSNVLSATVTSGTTSLNVGSPTWQNWTCDITSNNYPNLDFIHSSPQQDYTLFDLFTTRLNDNSVRGTLPVNAGMNRPDGGLAAWSALFSGMVVVSNNLPDPTASKALSYGSRIIDPAGPQGAASPLWQIVNGPNGINTIRTNAVMFPSQAFSHVGQILATPALSVASPFINTNTIIGTPVKTGPYVADQVKYGINDEEYEWLPQQIMGLVRGTEQRYVIYCFGQTLKPAPGGTVLSGNYFQMVTNYQVVAESAIRAVIRVDNANTPAPHAVVETYNVLPPN